MATIALSGNDTVSINNRVLTDFADGSCAELTFPNEIAGVKTGKNGNSIFSLNTSGRQAELKLRIMRGSSDDKFLNGLMASQNGAFETTVLLVGQLIKKIGDGTGKVISDTYVLQGGVFTKQVEAKSNVEGDVEQSVSIYTMRFSNAPRAIA